MNRNEWVSRAMNHVFGYELLPLKPNRHFTVFKRSADVHPPSQNVHLEPLAFVNRSAFFSKKPFCPSFLFKNQIFCPCLGERASAEHWFTGRRDTINLQSNWHNQHLHKSYQHSQALGACLGDSFMAHLQNATCQSAKSDSHRRAGTPHCHHDIL